MLNSGPTSAACGNIAIASAIDSSTFLPRELQPGDGVGGEHRDDAPTAAWRSARCRSSCAARVNSESLNTVW